MKTFRIILDKKEQELLQADPSHETLLPEWDLTSSYLTPDSPPLLFCGDRLIGFGSRTIFAVNIYTGEEIHTAGTMNQGGFPYPLSSQRGEPHLTYSSGFLYFMDGRKLQAVSIMDGAPKDNWLSPTIDRVVGLKAYQDIITVVYLDLNGSTCVQGFTAQDGSKTWGPYITSRQSPGEIIVGTGAVYFVAEGNLFAVNTDKGNTRFSMQSSSTGIPTPNLNQTISPLISSKTIVCVGDKIYGLDPINGAKVWEFTSQNASGSITWLTALNDSLDTIVASNSRGEVYALKAATGQVIWRSVLTASGKPTIAGNEVYIDIPQQENIYVLSLSDGTTSAIYNLAGNVSKARPVLGNGHLFIPTDDGLLHAVPYGDQNAAYFDGVSAWIDASSKYRQNSDPNSLFGFSSDEFSIEAWVRSSIGGCILSGKSETRNTFLMSLDQDGSICFAVMGSNQIDNDAAVSTKTWAVDGFWHHLAVVRQRMNVVMYLDGISIPVNLLQQRKRADDALQEQYGNISFLNGKPYRCADPPDTLPQGLSIRGQNSLAIGALYSDFNGSVAIDHYFEGLLREVRIWDKPLEPASVISRKGAELNDLLPNLVGNWHLNFDWKHDSTKTTSGDASFKNSVYLQEVDAVFHKANSCPTELAMDISAFPFQLEQESLCWPYTGQWQSRGQSKISSPPAVLSGGTICFTDEEAIYGVAKSTGLRKWGISLTGKYSSPVSYLDKVYLMTENFQEGLIEIDGDTGEKRILDQFKGIITKEMGNRVPAPAISDRYITALSPDGYVWVLDKTLASIDDSHKLHLGDCPDNLTIQGNWILATTETKGSFTLHIIDASARVLSPKSIPVNSPVYHIDNMNVYCVYQGSLSVFVLPELAAPKYKTTSVEGSKITGLETSSDENLLVVTTSVGMVYGLSFATLDLRWMTTLPEKPGASNMINGINPPTIDGRKVFVNSPSGTVAAIDGRSGDLLGLFYEKNPISTPMIIDNGTALFGCANATASQYLDGALHSIAFGKTYALRLGLDIYGNEVTEQNYAVIENSNILELMNVAECSVEAWVNTTKGGDILYCFPSKENNFGLHLFVDSDGKIGYTMIYIDEQTQKWNKIAGLTDLSKACNGKWHHIATRLSTVSGLQIYLDGTPQDIEKSNDIIAEPVNLDTGTKVFIGGSDTGVLTDKVVYYRGMIAEVRLWDTYLSVDEISNHMHIKLHGDEPSLLCYWNFATLGINDTAPGKFDGKLLSDNKNGCYWITDLPFNEPNYPYLTTKASICSIPDTGSTTYSLDIYAYKADNTALSNCDLELWYIKHAKDAGPDSIDIISGVKSATLAYVTPDHEALSKNRFTVTTDNYGKASLQITTSFPNHGPSLDLRSSFMTTNERYHLNVLIDNQKLTRPAPPVLTAQSSLMQDYSYSPGGTIDSSNSRNTYRTILKVSTADGDPVVGEALEISALEHLAIEVSGTEYQISPQNSYPFKTDYNGELIVVVEAKEIKVADLSVHAGYMHTGECVTVSIDQDAHTKLANLSADDMSQPRMTNWKPDSQGGPEKSTMLDNNYKSHAGEISQSVRHVMSSVNQQPASCTRLRTRNKNKLLGIHYDSNGIYIPMYQPSIDEPSDKAKTMVTMDHIMRVLPSDPDAITQSVKSQSGNALGFVFDNSDPSGLRFSYISNTQELTGEMGNPGLIHPIGTEILLGGLFSWIKRAFNAVKEAAAAALRAAQKLVIEIGEKVTAAIHYADEIVHKVIHTIKDAAEVVGEFFKQLGLLIWQIIKFLIFLFDWAAILKTHNIIKHSLLNGLNAYRGYAKSSLKGDFNRFFELIKKSIDGSSIPDSLATQSATGISSQYPPDSGSKHSNSVQGKYLTSKTQEHSDYASMPKNSSSPEGGNPLDQFDPKTTYDIIFKNLGSIVQNPSALVSMSLSDLKKIVTDLIVALIDLAEKMADAAIDLFTEIIDGFTSIISADIYIPFISALYKFITGSSLTLLDLFCLIIAIPLNVFYGLLTGDHFGDDFNNLPVATADIFNSSTINTVLFNNSGNSDDGMYRGFDYLFCIAEPFYGIFQAASDYFALKRTQGGNPDLWEGYLNAYQSLAGCIVSVSRLGSSLYEKDKSKIDWSPVAGILLAKSIFTLGKFYYEMEIAERPLSGKKSIFFTSLNAAMAGVVIIYSICLSDSSQVKATMEYICSAIPDLLSILTIKDLRVVENPCITKGKIAAICAVDLACAGAVTGLHYSRCI